MKTKETTTQRNTRLIAEINADRERNRKYRARITSREADTRKKLEALNDSLKWTAGATIVFKGKHDYTQHLVRWAATGWTITRRAATLKSLTHTRKDNTKVDYVAGGFDLTPPPTCKVLNTWRLSVHLWDVAYEVHINGKRVLRPEWLDTLDELEQG